MAVKNTKVTAKKGKEVVLEAKADTVPQEDNGELLLLITESLERSIENEQDERDKGSADIKFIAAEDQWDDAATNARGPNRIKLTINTLPTYLDQIDGDLRLHKVGVSVKPVDDISDTEKAEIFEGIIRHIERNSQAARIYAYGGLHAAAQGRGAWRINTKFISDTSFKQTIYIDRIENAYSVYYDPAAKRDDKQDGDYFVVTSDISKKAYKREFGKTPPTDFNMADSSNVNPWAAQDNMVRIAEYFYRKKTGSFTLCQLQDGRVFKQSEIPEEAKDIEVVRTRDVSTYEIHWVKVDGKRVLDGPKKVPGKMFPIILTWGKQLCLDGKIDVRGIARYAKDACKMYNYFRTTEAETVSLQPKQPYLMPDVCIGPYQTIWDNSHNKLYPYLPYHVDDANPQMKPTRERAPGGSQGHMEQVSVSQGEIRDTVGIQKAAMGIASNETSGRAIRERKMETDTGQFAYMDNLSDAIYTTYRVLVNMIPEVYDTERIIRIIGQDMEEKVIEINKQGGIDLSAGEYDIDAQPDKSYSTQREELLDKVQSIAQYMPPEQFGVISDLIVSALDMPKATEMAKRIRKTIPANITGDDSSPTGGTEGGPGSPSPGAPPPPPPDPTIPMKVAQEEVKVQQEQVKLEILKATLELTKTKVTAAKGGAMDKHLKEVEASMDRATAGNDEE